MSTYKILAAILVLTLATLACSIDVNLDLPEINTMETGPTITEDILVPLPDGSEPYDFEILFGAGKLFLNPGAEQGLAEGTATYNVKELNPQIQDRNGGVRLQQGDGRFDFLPNFGRELEMEWDLQLANVPMNLVLNGGANQTEAELGGLSLVSLEINQGAADAEFRFSAPNQVVMENLEINAGAANMNFYGLAFTNLSDDLHFRGGAGNYTLDFSGDLLRDLDVRIEAGLGNVNIVVPEGVKATLTMEGTLTNVNTSGTWEKSDDTYSTAGDGFEINIRVSMGAGNLDLEN
jgi:hypothetical protein